jgi:hypothetical protein
MTLDRRSLLKAMSTISEDLPYSHGCVAVTLKPANLYKMRMPTFFEMSPLSGAGKYRDFKVTS